MIYSAQVAVDGRVNTAHPPEVMARIDGVCAFHEATKRLHQPPSPTDPRPSLFRVFADRPRIALPTHLLDAPVGTLRLMSMGKAALPDSFTSPPQNLRTLATWLHMAAGITGKANDTYGVKILRPYASAGGLYPCEIYVLALGIEGLDPGLYHFSAKEFSLRKLREGWESLSQLKRGRPDLEILKTMPAVLLVSTVIARTAWKYGARAYRYAAIDAGHLIENLSLTATGLGIQTVVRLHINERNSRELIGVTKDAPFSEYEPVQGFVAWGDKAIHPIAAPAQRTGSAILPPIVRPPAVPVALDVPEVRTAHEQCVAPGVGVVELRPPHTEVCPLPNTEMRPLASQDINADMMLLQALKARTSTRQFDQAGISRDQFAKLNHVAFRGGSYYPVLPDGPHMGIIRPFWYIHGVNGVQSGLWYYHANHDKFTAIRYGDYRFDAKYLFNDQATCGEASAVCIMAANLRYMMNNSGPDAYRLAHLEAGIAGQRMYLACAAMGIECCAAGEFNDEDLRKALDMAGTDWQCLYGFAVGGMRKRPVGASVGMAAEMRLK